MGYPACGYSQDAAMSIPTISDIDTYTLTYRFAAAQES